MQRLNIEKQASRLISFGAAFTTIFLLSGNITDPVNVTKLFSLGTYAIAALAVVIYAGTWRHWKAYKMFVGLAIVFVGIASLTLFTSEAPVPQTLWGVYGRNNGFFTYFFLVCVSLVVLTFNRIESLNSINLALIIAGLVNVAYSGWVLAFGDFMGWENPYGNILGTLGNPNFIGSFLGMFIVSFTLFAVRKETPSWVRYSAFVIVPLTFFEIYKSHAIQGRVVAVLGFGISGFYYLRSRFGKLILFPFTLLASLTGIFSLLGALQIGPLTSIIYKTSVSLRGQYWLAGWNTGESHLLTGVGMDSFGDWYRRSRSAHAIELPGVNVVVNAAHNVPLDIFAFGGLPLFVAYLGLILAVVIAIVKVTLRSKSFDPVFVSLVTAWIGYQIQSIISINQIGLAIWGWTLGGALLVYEKLDKTRLAVSTETTSKVKNKQQTGLLLTPVISLGMLVGFILASPPLISDAKWRSAQLSLSAVALENTMKPSYFNPQNSTKYLTNIQLLESSGLFDLSHKYALAAVEFNPESFELWKVLYLVKNSSDRERNVALLNMKRLDPLNPDVTSQK